MTGVPWLGDHAHTMERSFQFCTSETPKPGHAKTTTLFLRKPAQLSEKKRAVTRITGKPGKQRAESKELKHSPPRSDPIFSAARFSHELARLFPVFASNRRLNLLRSSWVLGRGHRNRLQPLKPPDFANHRVHAANFTARKVRPMPKDGLFGTNAPTKVIEQFDRARVSLG